MFYIFYMAIASICFAVCFYAASSPLFEIEYIPEILIVSLCLVLSSVWMITIWFIVPYAIVKLIRRRIRKSDVDKQDC